MTNKKEAAKPAQQRMTPREIRDACIPIDNELGEIHVKLQNLDCMVASRTSPDARDAHNTGTNSARNALCAEIQQLRARVEQLTTERAALLAQVPQRHIMPAGQIVHGRKS